MVNGLLKSAHIMFYFTSSLQCQKPATDSIVCRQPVLKCNTLQ